MRGKVILVGFGNVGYHLSLALKELGLQVTVMVRPQAFDSLAEQSSNHSPNIKLVCDPSNLPEDAEFVFLTVKDDQIQTAASGLSTVIKNNACFLHSSGIKPWNQLEGICQNYGIFYPLNSFSKELAFNWEGVPVFIKTSNNESESKLFEIAGKLESRAVADDLKIREYLHLAAVFLNNFTNHMLVKADEILTEENIPFDFLHPLLKTTVEKALESAPRNVQTGPAIRGDFQTIARHLKMLSEFSDRKLYQLISESINPQLKSKL